jgi:uncharacterized membrane protein SpoIIM required for sporulation
MKAIFLLIVTDINKMKIFLSLNLGLYVISLFICIYATYGSYVNDQSNYFGGNTPSYTGLIINNGKVFITLLLANLIFGIAGSILLVINGAFHGISMGVFLSFNSLSELLSKLMPYAFLEVSALVIAASTGQYICFKFWKTFRTNKKNITTLLKANVPIIILGVGLLIISSIIEHYLL